MINTLITLVLNRIVLALLGQFSVQNLGNLGVYLIHSLGNNYLGKCLREVSERCFTVKSNYVETEPLGFLLWTLICLLQAGREC